MLYVTKCSALVIKSLTPGQFFETTALCRFNMPLIFLGICDSVIPEHALHCSGCGQGQQTQENLVTEDAEYRTLPGANALSLNKWLNISGLSLLEHQRAFE